MRSLSDAQWARYFKLVETLERIPAEQRRDTVLALRANAEELDVLWLAELRLGLTPDFDRDRSGERIRNLVLREQIGRGGMGVIYRAVQLFSGGIEREVAVKLIHPELTAYRQDEALKRFQQEIGALVKLEHRGVARIYDGGLHRDPDRREETLFFAMEFVRGKPVTQYVAQNRAKLGITGTLRLFLRVCDAVAHAHRQGIIHRDLKPVNVLVDADGEPRIIDFGLAQACGTATTAGQANRLSGTPAYMSPEQIYGVSALTPASDLYSLGIILGELLTGQRPRQNNGCTPTSEDLTRHSPEWSRELRQTLTKATATSANDRYSSAEALSKAIGHCLKAAELQEQRALQSREFLMRKVQSFWIDGVLNNSLHAAVSIELGLAIDTDAVEHPWDLIIQMRDQVSRPLPPGTRVGDAFRDLGEAMLILGVPGAGKTTLLLELARDLLALAKQDSSRRVPVVFHLSTWAQQRLALADWLVDELDKRYYLPPGAGRTCLASAQLAVLLDGLDEVTPAHRAACVIAINEFRKQYGSMPVAVCCRVADYDALPLRLRLGGAVAIQSLTREQIDGYFRRAGEALAGVRMALGHDEQLWALIKTPLLLSIAALAYHNNSCKTPKIAATLDQRRTQLFATYAEAMFARRSKTARYTTQQTMRWLGWLASAMQRHHQSVFYLEWMQPDWLVRPIERWAISVGSVLLCGGLVGLVVGYCASRGSGHALSFPISLTLGLAGGLVFGLLGHGDQVRPIVRLGWSWAALRDGLGRKLVLAIGAGALLCVGIALVFDVAVGIAVGLATSVAFGYFGGLDLELSRNDPGRLTVPNQGIRQSLRNVLLGATTGAVSGTVLGAVAGGTAGALFGASVFALVIALLVGGHPCLQHFILRLLLWRNRFAPLSYVDFLEYAVERIFLRRVGGGYAFVHRALLDYFAATYTPISSRKKNSRST
jgi:serine/threonine protein kinase